jgi:hypothetical protein
MSGAQSARMHNPPQPQPRVVRPQPAAPDVPRAGSRVVASVDSVGLVEAGKQTGTPTQPVQRWRWC